MSARHVINQQRFDLHFARHDEATEIQGQISRLFSERWAPALSEMFDRLAPPERVIRLGTIELDFGSITKRELLSTDFTRKLLGQLEREIVETNRTARAGISVLPLNASGFSLWLHFLEHGVLHPNAAVPVSQEEWHRQIFAALVEENGAIQRLQQLLAAQPRALERLVLQYEETFLEQLLTLCTGHEQHRLPAALRELGAVLAACFQTAPALAAWLVQPDFWPRIFPRRRVPRDLPAIAAAVRATVHGQRSEADEPLPGLPPGSATPTTMLRKIQVKLWQVVLEIALTQRLRLAPPELLARVFQHQTLRRVQGPLAVALAQNDSFWRNVTRTSEPALVPSPPTFDKRGTPALPPMEKKAPPPAAADGAFYIENAGVVLLHPFLSRYFTRLDLCTGPVFNDEASRHLAVCLVHHLATGEVQSPEYQLLLPKLLCGMPLYAPLDHALIVSAQAQTEGKLLLQAAIDHWGAFRSTSPAGLREGFLQRAGKLEFKSAGWLLQIERKTLDVLLGKLPWGLGIIKLPWMNEILRVEWS